MRKTRLYKGIAHMGFFTGPAWVIDTPKGRIEFETWERAIAWISTKHIWYEHLGMQYRRVFEGPRASA